MRVENEIDLWHLQHIVEAGDSITAKTPRMIFVQRGDEKEKGMKKFVLLTIKVEKFEFDEHKNKLRLAGKILEAPEEVQLGSYHTIEVGVGKLLSIEKKEWKEEQEKRLERAEIRMEVLREPKIIEEFFVHVNKEDGLAVYGFEEVKTATSIGAVKIILIDEEKIRETRMEELVKEVENKRGEIKLVSKKFQAGQKFCKMCDVGAILRFSIS